MNMKTRIAKFLITLTSFTVMASVNAYQGSDCCNPCNPCCCTYDPCCPQPNRCFYGEVDYIYWSVHQDGLNFVNSGFGVACCNEEKVTCDCDCNSSSCSSDSCGCHDIDRNWNSGFKVGAGFANPCCDWEFFVQYTYYQANPKRHVEKTRCELYPVWGFFNDFLIDNPGLLVTADVASSRWKLNFNSIDGLITNEFCINNCFTFRPSFGLKGAWISQHFHVFYDFDNEIPGTLLPEGYRVNHRQRFWGIGPKVAVTAAATLFENFSLWGNLGFSTLWSKFEPRRFDFIINNGIGTDSEDLTGAVCARRCFYNLEPVLETSFGLRWDTDLCCGDYGFYVNLAWEGQVWFNHNRLVDFNPNYTHGDLTLQGVTVGAGFSF